MAETKSAKSAESAAPVPQTNGASEAPASPPAAGPIVLKLKRGKKNKKGYSKEFRDLQRSEAKLSKIAEKAARAAAKGAIVYNKARKKSAGNKRDGAMRDFGLNLAEGLSASLRRASSIPVDAAEAMNTKSSRRLMRGQMRLARNGLRLWRL